jgi:hypothetical protein
MAKKKFKAKSFKVWLDCLARLLVKTRDEWTCQYDECQGPVGVMEWHHIRYRTLNHLRWDLNNGITLCSSCHRKWHNGAKLQVWFERTFLARFDWIYSKPKLLGTWKEQDFLDVQDYLVQKCIDLEVDTSRLSASHSKRLTKLMAGDRLTPPFTKEIK